ncbi:uncharacterized protein B0T23DRAFT_179145 [Neurospora hispaniola]|uniref:Transmembrane protein n=1 Tax=Neurospora hispaniola TaxID=588809 RepID=A0AAJ0I6N4_9PEZI|nr:hypothetical protein B0T23DRAFT_179145 [Neurospora hispaniola]
MRRDEDKWQKSLVKTIIKANESWGFWIASWLDRECFWASHVYERFLWPSLFRCVGGYGELGRVVRGGGGMWVWRGELCFLGLGLAVLLNNVDSRQSIATSTECWNGISKTAGNRSASFLAKKYQTCPFPMPMRLLAVGKREKSNVTSGGWRGPLSTCCSSGILVGEGIISLGLFAWWWWWW